jgi:hypothetical protein
MEPVGLHIQGLQLGEQVLVLARLTSVRSGVGEFTPKQINELFQELSLPSPAKTSNVLATLEGKKLVRRGRATGVWQVTPLGIASSRAMVKDIDLAAIEAEAATTGTLLGGAAHPVILPEYGAPPALIPILRHFLDEHEFDRNVMGMTRFPNPDAEAPPDPVQDALEIARSVCESHGLEFHLASDRQLHDDLWTNIAAHMWACRYGIAFFEDLATPRRGLNYNLTIEVGGRLMAGRRCALLKDTSIEKLPTDLVGQIRKDVQFVDLGTIDDVLHRWIRDDLQLGPCSNCSP